MRFVENFLVISMNTELILLNLPPKVLHVRYHGLPPWKLECTPSSEAGRGSASKVNIECILNFFLMQKTSIRGHYCTSGQAHKILLESNPILCTFLSFGDINEKIFLHLHIHDDFYWPGSNITNEAKTSRHLLFSCDWRSVQYGYKLWSTSESTQICVNADHDIQNARLAGIFYWFWHHLITSCHSWHSCRSLLKKNWRERIWRNLDCSI